VKRKLTNEFKQTNKAIIIGRLNALSLKLLLEISDNYTSNVK